MVRLGVVLLVFAVGFGCKDDPVEVPSESDAGFVSWDGRVGSDGSSTEDVGGASIQDASEVVVDASEVILDAAPMTPDAFVTDALAADALVALADATVPNLDAATGPSDTGPIPDGSVVDSGPQDAGALSVGPIQCRTASDCGGLSCNATAPGGICSGCGGDTDCPELGMVCVFGACVRECSSDSDCNAGFSCGGTGRCLLRRCSAGCPAPYVCGGDFCARPACVSGSCPAPLVCQEQVCVEP